MSQPVSIPTAPSDLDDHTLLASNNGVEEGDPLISRVDGELSRFRLNDVKCFGVDLTPDNVAVAIVYFVQGVLGLAKLAVGFYLKDDLHLDPAEVVDSMVVERARGESLSMSGSLQSLCWGSSAFGGIVSSYFSGSLVDSHGVRFVFGVTALLPLLTSAVAVLVEEERVCVPLNGPNLPSTGLGFIETSKQHILNLWAAVRQPNVYLPTLFIFLWQATPQSDSAMFFFTTNKLGFTPEFLGRVKLVTSIASLVGVALYNGFLKKASFMPVLVLAARICPEGMEATLFATLMSIFNGGSLVGGLVGAALTHLFGITKDRFDNLTTLVILCNLSSLLPLPLLGLLPEESSDLSSKESSDVEMKTI